MINGYYNIQPIEVKVGADVSTAVNATFNASYPPFATSMTFGWAIYSADGATLYSSAGIVDEAQLAQWGDNDDYIINVMASIAGLTIIW